MLIETDEFVMDRIAPGDSLDSGQTALIIVDMMNRFCDADWHAAGDAARASWIAAELPGVESTIEEALQTFRGRGALVVHVVNARWTDSGREVVPYQRGRDYDLFDTEAMSVIDSLKPKSGEIVIRKVTSSAFTGTGLDFMLRNAGIRNVVLCGQFGNACVFYTMIQARELGYSNYWLEGGNFYSSERTKSLFSAVMGLSSRWTKLVSVSELAGALRSSA